MSITDNVTVMRKGITIKSLKTSKTNPKKLAAYGGTKYQFTRDKKK